MHKFRILATLSAMTLSPALYADIEVWVRDRNGAATPVQLTGAVASGNSVTITPAAISAVTNHSVLTEWIVWVFDTDAMTTDPDEDIGSITIDASGGDYGSTIRLLVAPAPLAGAIRSHADFESAPSLPMFAGSVNLGPIIVTPSSYENAVAVSIAVTGDVGSSTASPRDQITIGQVYRLQANGRSVSGTLVGGNIYADITAKTYSTQPYGSLAIGEITAAKSIHGKVEAPGFFDTQERRADIDTIRVTMAEASDPGITGDIKAERGEIKSIITTGKIGTSGSASPPLARGSASPRSRPRRTRRSASRPRLLHRGHRHRACLVYRQPNTQHKTSSASSRRALQIVPDCMSIAIRDRSPPADRAEFVEKGRAFRLLHPASSNVLFSALRGGSGVFDGPSCHSPVSGADHEANPESTGRCEPERAGMRCIVPDRAR